MIRTLAYGTLAPTTGAEQMRKQLSLAHRYQHALCEIERNRRAVRQDVLDSEPTVTESRAAALALPERDRKAAWQAHRVAIKAAIAKHAEALAEIEERAKDLTRAARATCGCYWGTYLVVEDAMQRARRSGEEPRFRRWDGSGIVAVQIQGGLSVAELLAGEDTRARLLPHAGPERAHGNRDRLRDIWIRVGSDGRAPIWAVVPIVYHRELPPDATIRWVRLAQHRVATHHQLSAQFVIETEAAALPAPGLGTIAIDVGWRRVEGGMRVAAWVDDAGGEGTLVMPERLLIRWEKVADLRSIRDLNFNAALACLVKARRAGGLPPGIHEATQHAHQCEAPARLAALTLRWRRSVEGASLVGEHLLRITLEPWRRQDKHLLEWESHQRESVLRARRDLYRRFARQIAGYRRVVVEHLDLRAFAELPEPTGGQGSAEDPRTTAARGRRFTAALSELLGCAADAVQRAGGEWIEAKADWTTQTCHACGEREEFDAAGAIDHTCSACGAAWDQDLNAARNLLRAAQSSAVSGERSRAKTPTIPGESEVARRRRAGKARKRTGRSQDEAQALEITRGPE